MRLVVTSDLHYGLKSAGYDRTPEVHHVAKRIVDFAIRKEADAFLHLGDLGHMANPPSLIHAMWVELFDKLEEAQIQSWFLLGNHDVTTRSANPSGSLAVLQELGYEHVKAVTEVTCITTRHGVDIVCLPYPLGSQNVQWPGTDGRPTLVLTHLNVDRAKVNDEHVMRQVNVGIPEEVFEDDNVRLVLSGHIHRPQRVSAKNIIVGSPICTDFGDKTKKTFLDIVFGKSGSVKIRKVKSACIPLVQLDYDLLGGDELVLDEDEVDYIEGAGVKVKVRCNEDQREQLNLKAFESEVAKHASFVRPIVPTVVRMRDEKRATITADMTDADAVQAWLKVRKPSGRKMILKCALAALEDA